MICPEVSIVMDKIDVTISGFSTDDGFAGFFNENYAIRLPQWKLSLDTYGWIFTVMYPKHCPNKKEPTP